MRSYEIFYSTRIVHYDIRQPWLDSFMSIVQKPRFWLWTTVSFDMFFHCFNLIPTWTADNRNNETLGHFTSVVDYKISWRVVTISTRTKRICLARILYLRSAIKNIYRVLFYNVFGRLTTCSFFIESIELKNVYCNAITPLFHYKQNYDKIKVRNLWIERSY